MGLLDQVYKKLQPGLELLARYDAGEPVQNDLDPLSLAFVSVDQVIELHARFSAAPLRSWELLESALARPIQESAYAGANIWELAAILAEGIIRNHPFIDGNKRAALLGMGAFLAMNGYGVPEPSEKAAMLIIAIAEKRITLKEAGDLLAMMR